MFTLHMFFCTVVISVLLSLGHFGFCIDDRSDLINNQSDDTTESRNKNDLEFLKKLFYERRKKHLTAAKNIKNIQSYEQRYKMISVIIDEMINIIESKKLIIERVNDELKRNPIAPLSNGNIKDALLSVSENTALFGDIVLENPDIMHRILKKKMSWYETFKWSLTFVNENPLLLDDATIKILKLVFQELNLTKRTGNYSNHNSNENLKMSSYQNVADIDEKSKKIRKTKRKHGPQIVHIDL